MKKLALAVIATAFIAIGHAPVSAQTPITPIPDNRLVECGESTGRIDVDGDGIADSCVEFYVAASPPVVQVSPPAVAPPALVPSAPLPRTGSSISPFLGLGGALLVGGGIIVVATRRRSTATAA